MEAFVFFFLILCVLIIVVFHIRNMIKCKKFKNHLDKILKSAQDDVEKLLKEIRRKVIMDNYIFKNKNGHIEVYDRKGNFILSADSEAEAEREIENM